MKKVTQLQSLLIEHQGLFMGGLVANREEHNWSLRRSAKELGFSPSFMSRLEQGKEGPTLKLILAISDRYQDIEIIQSALLLWLGSLPVSRAALVDAAEILARSIQEDHLLKDTSLYRCAKCDAAIGIDDSKVCTDCYQRGAR